MAKQTAEERAAEIKRAMRVLEDLALKNPHMRIGQLLWWVADGDPFYMTDEDAQARALKCMERF